MTGLVLAAMAIGLVWGVAAAAVELADQALARRNAAVGRTCVPAPRRPTRT